MANDSGLFRTQDDLTALGAEFDGWAWQKGEQRWLPLYEAKMLSHYDHRFSTYEDATQAQLNVGYAAPADRRAARRPRARTAGPLLGGRVRRRGRDRRPLGPRLAPRLARHHHARVTRARSFHACCPRSACGPQVPARVPSEPAGVAGTLQAAWSSLVFDYVARQKLSGTNMTYFVVKQLACPGPGALRAAAPWDPSIDVRRVRSSRASWNSPTPRIGSLATRVTLVTTGRRSGGFPSAAR